MNTLLTVLLFAFVALVGYSVGSEAEKRKHKGALKFYKSIVESLEKQNEDKSKRILALRREIEKTWRSHANN